MQEKLHFMYLILYVTCFCLRIYSCKTLRPFHQWAIWPCPIFLNNNACCVYITWVTRGSSSLSTARVRISRLFGSHLKLMFGVLMFVMVSGILGIKKWQKKSWNRWPRLSQFHSSDAIMNSSVFQNTDWISRFIWDYCGCILQRTDF